MAQKIIKIGSSLGVTLKSHILEQAGLRVGDSVRVEFDAKEQCIRVESTQRDEIIRSVAHAQELVQRHSDELAKLGRE